MFLAIIAIVFLLDQGSKLAVQTAMYHGESIAVFPPVFYFTYVMNPGAAFGLLAHRSTLFIIVGLLLVGGVLLAYKRLAAGRVVVKTGLGLVVGGALGNLVDRLRYGMVVDFLDFHWRGIHWPAFNLADVFVVCAALVWCIASMKAPPRQPKPQKAPEELHR